MVSKNIRMTPIPGSERYDQFQAHVKLMSTSVFLQKLPCSSVLHLHITASNALSGGVDSEGAPLYWQDGYI